MNILCLYGNECAIPLFEWLEAQGHKCILSCEKDLSSLFRIYCFDLAVSFSYPYLIRKDIIDIMHGNVVNLHISYLPFNKGGSPNIWSLVNGTPRGASLHYVNENFDEGDIIYQELLDPVPSDADEETLRTTYNSLNQVAIEVFKKAFAWYDFWPQMRKKCEQFSDYYTDRQQRQIVEILPSYDLSVSEFHEYYEEALVRIKNGNN